MHYASSKLDTQFVETYDELITYDKVRNS